ncbi:2'-5' RNA ligase [Nocardioides thalensis]|uniref:2'-5' RNA ligase n=1 Tax=Nocardioides thalensis TaxID=1914755 RepID=A0A853C5Y8_9ACTN|nr:2'-5' RNA ligase family protein [Nocardioides thalensis]NYJ02571.1 2'-5' RNA ligase [Nocardioides thalensis]
MSTFRTEPPGGSDGMTTIGVAIEVPEPWATELHEFRLSVGDPTAAGVPTHITLIPPMAIDGDLAGIEQHLAEAAAGRAPFRVHLRGTGTFRPVSPVVFVGLVEGISECELLADAVRRGPLAVDLDFPYHPHVTVAHHVGDAALDRAFEELAGFECVFDVTEFQLYVHHGPAGWKATRSFPL